MAEQRKGKKDVVMKDAEDEKHEVKKIVGKAAKAAEKAFMLKQEDEKLYRKHGMGLDTGNY